jgi:hypothetical protein
MKDDIGLYSLVVVRYLDRSQNLWSSDVINKYAIVSGGDENEFELTFLYNGSQSAWYNIKQLKLISNNINISLARKILKRCDKISSLIMENSNDIQEFIKRR